MPFSDFKNIEDVSKKYKTSLGKGRFTKSISEKPLPDWFMEDLEYSLTQKKPRSSEIAISENFISPLLRFVARQHLHLVYWSREYDFNIDADLCGTPDYVFSYTKKPEIIDFNMPLVCVAEAKVEKFAEAWGQVLAELVACQKLFPEMTLYGFATNGEIWQFGKLENTLFTQDIDSYSISNDAPKITGILDWVFTQAVLQAEKYLAKNKN
ncbi:MAG: hypothetical protein EAZ97_10780 [Bacteroidetes bacterium]|nr:MAG: hypothetical protein EAZ97_10780 [Bacteroidota bacterium]